MVFKKLIICLLCIVVFGCGGGGGGSGSDPQDSGDKNDTTISDGTVVDDSNTGSQPFLMKASSYLYEDGEFYETTIFDIGDTFTFSVTFTDIDKDVSVVVVTMYHPSDAETPYYGPMYYSIPPQEDEVGVYIPSAPITMIGPSGTWRVEFVLEDSMGNNSNVITKNAMVN